MAHFTNEQISLMDKFYRINLINSLTGYKSLHLLGTADVNGLSNLCIVSSVFHLGANPPLIGLVMRPERSHNDTLRNIRSTGQYTLNNVLPAWYKKAHHTSASYPSGVSEFYECGLKKLYVQGFDVPFVASSTVRIGLQLRETLDIELNGTTIVIGEIVHAEMPDHVLTHEGAVDHVAAGTMTVAGLDTYFLPELVGRLSYARPGAEPTEIID